jgi:hypothetical protein
MMIEGSGSGAESESIPLTKGSGSGRPKNMCIRWIRIRNTGNFYESLINCENPNPEGQLIRYGSNASDSKYGLGSFSHFLPGENLHITTQLSDFVHQIYKLIHRRRFLLNKIRQNGGIIGL